MSLVFDIETQSLPESHVLQFAGEFVPPDCPGAFDPQSVKYGQTKDPAKRAEKLRDCEQKHAALVENYSAECDRLEAEWKAKILDKAALDPATASLVVIGITNPVDGKFGCTEGKSEPEALEWFWSKYQKCRKPGRPDGPGGAGGHGTPRPMIGHNIKQFDLPFLVIRSRILQVDVPREVWDAKWRKWDEIFVDTLEHWKLGRFGNDCPASLDYVGKALGLGGKLAGPDGSTINGKDFGKLWEQDRELARRYLHRDLELTARVAVRLGVC